MFKNPRWWSSRPKVGWLLEEMLFGWLSGVPLHSTPGYEHGLSAVAPLGSPVKHFFNAGDMSPGGRACALQLLGLGSSVKPPYAIGEKPGLGRRE
jgi:hypothetical protein